MALKKSISGLGLALGICIVTFPALSPDYGIGLDASYGWALNWLWVYDLPTLQSLTYPIGPLGFLKIPSTEGNNLLWSICFFSVVKLTLIFTMFRLSIPAGKHWPTWFAVLAATIACAFSNLDVLIIASCLALTTLYLRDNKVVWILPATLLAAIGLYIKSSIGISATSIVVVGAILSYFQNRNVKKLAVCILAMALLVITIGLVLFLDIERLSAYLWGIKEFSSGYSLFSLHPENNWIALSAAFGLLALFGTLHARKGLGGFMLLALFPLFAMWKHAMVRQDMSHYPLLISFVIVLGCVTMLVPKKMNWRVSLLPTAIIALLWVNMSGFTDGRSLSPQLNGFRNIAPLISNYPAFMEKHAAMAAEAQEAHRLPADVRAMIGNATIDIHPWEYSYIIANGLNWSPRPTLEISGTTTQWASTRNADHYTPANATAPRFVLFHLVKDRYDGCFGSIDDRYVLNDEPKLIYNLLNHYQIVAKNPAFLLFEMKDGERLSTVNLDNAHEYHYGEWLDVPAVTNEIVRLRVNMQRSMAERLQVFLYKEMPYHIDYMLEDGSVLSYRFVPALASEGMWCHPLVLQPQQDVVEQRAIKVRLRCTDQAIAPGKATVQFERIALSSYAGKAGQQGLEHTLFSKNPRLTRKLMHRQGTHPGAENVAIEVIPPLGYSWTPYMQLDSLWNMAESDVDNLTVEALVYAYSTNAGTGLVVTVEGSADNVWRSKSLVMGKDAERVFTKLSLDLNRQSHSTGMLKAYVWNNDSSEVKIAGLRLDVFAIINSGNP